jgi:murein DD-endopeptidase MepM/ murein hydrolase activator NlpD
MHRTSCCAFAVALIAATPVFPANARSQESNLAASCDCSEPCPSGTALLSRVFERQGIRLSSPFAWRIHPIFKTLEFHKGIDIAAAQGTPVHLLIAGVVEEAARKGTYGLYVKIRHSLDYETVYAHLSAFAGGVHPGLMLRQGDILAYVGSTGLSTAPHLHLETLVHDRPVDPLCPSPAESQSVSIRRSSPAKPITQKVPLRTSAARKSRKRRQL